MERRLADDGTPALRIADEGESAKKFAARPVVAQKAGENRNRELAAALVARQRRVIVPAQLAQRAPDDHEGFHREKQESGRPAPAPATGSDRRPGEARRAGSGPAGRPRANQPLVAASEAAAATPEVAGRMSQAESRPVQLLFVLVSEEDTAARPAAAPAATPATNPMPPDDDGAALHRRPPTQLAARPLARG
jgi:hypothetical protein